MSSGTGNIIFAFLLFLTISAASSASAAMHEDEAKRYFEQAKNLIHNYSGVGNNYEQAVELAEKIYNKDATSAYSYLILAELKARQYKDYRQGEPGEIWSLTDRVIGLNPNIADVYVVRSKMALLAGKLEQAHTEADKATALDALNKEAMFAKAQAEEASNRFNNAESWYRKAIESHADSDRQSNIYYWLAQMFLKTEPPQVTKADEAMEKCVALSPSSPWKLVNYAIFLNTQTDDYGKAADYAKKSLAIMEFPMGRHTLAMARYGQWSKSLSQNIVEARNQAAKIAEETSVTPREAYEYASRYMKRSKIAKALTDAELLTK